jgi:hypothetical protein
MHPDVEQVRFSYVGTSEHSQLCREPVNLKQCQRFAVKRQRPDGLDDLARHGLAQTS